MAIPDPQRLVGVISGMIVWAIWFVTVYGLTGVGCKAGWNQIRVPPANLLSLLMLLATLGALALIGWCAWRGFDAWRQAQYIRLAGGAETGRRQRFMALVMLLLSGLAGLGTLMIALPILMLDPCAS